MAGDVRDNAEAERYELHVEGALAGFIDYHRHNDLIALVHTEVQDGFEGQGIGSRLVAGALADIRAKRESVLPFCPFVRGYIAKHPDEVDLVPEPFRARFDL